MSEKLKAGRKVSSDNPASVLRREFRRAKKSEPDLTMTEYKKRAGIPIGNGGRPFGHHTSWANDAKGRKENKQNGK